MLTRLNYVSNQAKQIRSVVTFPCALGCPCIRKIDTSIVCTTLAIVRVKIKQQRVKVNCFSKQLVGLFPRRESNRARVHCLCMLTV